MNLYHYLIRLGSSNISVPEDLYCFLKMSENESQLKQDMSNIDDYFSDDSEFQQLIPEIEASIINDTLHSDVGCRELVPEIVVSMADDIIPESKFYEGGETTYMMILNEGDIVFDSQFYEVLEEACTMILNEKDIVMNTIHED